MKAVFSESQRKFLAQRAALVQALRLFFVRQGYLEVETPVRLPALIPEAHIEPEAAGGRYLQTSPEVCMKRLVAAGYPRIFQLARCFRREERGRLHLPEFTLLEWYRTGADYRDLMAECEAMLPFVASECGLEGRLSYAGRSVGLEAGWERLSVAEAFARFAPLPVEEALKRDSFDELLVEYIEPRLGREKPTFLYDYPAPLAALARKKPEDPAVAERFELYIAGLELANGFSELIDPAEQRARFEREQELIRARGRDPGPAPERFLEDLGRMAPTAGIALGVDRLVMLFTGAETIDRVVAFAPEEL